MGDTSQKRKIWALTYCSLFASVAYLAVARADNFSEGDLPENVDPPLTNTDTNTDVRESLTIDSETENLKLVNDFQKKTSCEGSAASRFLLLVSTLDGKISALNMQKEGQIEWSIDTGTRDMLSSSISKIEVNRDGKKTRLIPSLDGGLYQYDGDTIEPVPFNADTLLSSSFKFNDNSIVVGGKETEAYGIDAKSGKVKYVCDTNGCNYLNKNDNTIEESDETLVITRKTKTVRAVDITTGSEKWNFSVGQHEVAYVTASKNQVDPEPAITDASGQGNVNSDNSEEYPEPCIDEMGDTNDDTIFSFPWWNNVIDPHDIELKVIVPRGLIIAMSKSNPNQILWQHKFKTAIANAWNLFDGKLTEIDLFDATTIPALSMDQESPPIGAESYDYESVMENPVMYIGSHEKQFYVQPSVRMMQHVEEHINKAIYKGQNYQLDMPQVKWKPYIATAPSRTPAEINHPLQITWQNGVPYDEKSVVIWREYPYDVGYYLFPDFTPMKLNPDDQQNSSHNDPSMFGVSMKTVEYWWLEITLLTLSLAVLINVFALKILRKKLDGKKSTVDSEPSKSENSCENDKSGGSINSEKSLNDVENYQSRYYNDFDQVACLGKGGFGVVFQSKNKLDDCDYAVKRITLQNSDKAREKVMREVKALAKLEHKGIVRYFQAWMETPPAGWQEDRDRTELYDLSFSPTPGYIVTEYTPSPDHTNVKWTSPTRPRRRNKSETKAPSSFNPLQPYGDSVYLEDGVSETDDSSFHGDGDCGASGMYPFHRNGSTEPFIPHLGGDIEDESGSFCFGVGCHGNEAATEASASNEDSFDVLFSDKTDSKFETAPFKQYKDISSSQSDVDKQAKSVFKDVSFDIVFEDSGCVEKSQDETNPVEDRGHAVIDVSFSNNTHSLSSTRSESPGNQTLVQPARPNSLDLVDDDDQKPSVRPKNCDALPPRKLYLYIQMQLCQKESLKEWLACNTLNRDKQRIIDTFGQIVEAVAYVHDKGLMHRDLKPSNIFFSLDGTVKIGDFGLVTALEECGEMSGAMSVVRTPASVYFNKHTDQVGTKLYMSPEQIDGKNYTHKVDIYALGLICFELFYPFSTQMERVRTLLEVKRQIFPSNFLRELPKECAFVKNLLSPCPETRPSAADILENDLLTHFHESVASISRCRTCSQSSKEESH